jgi:hypothetical protein
MTFPGTYNFPYYLGDTYTFVLHPKNSDGTPFDLSGYTAKFFIADRRGVLGVQHEAQAIVDSVNSKITCTILPGVGRSLSAGSFLYDVEIKAGIENILTIATGSISITSDIAGAVI